MKLNAKFTKTKSTKPKEYQTIEKSTSEDDKEGAFNPRLYLECHPTAI